MSPLPQIHLRAIERISVRDVWPSESVCHSRTRSRHSHEAFHRESGERESTARSNAPCQCPYDHSPEACPHASRQAPGCRAPMVATGVFAVSPDVPVSLSRPGLLPSVDLTQEDLGKHVGLPDRLRSAIVYHAALVQDVGPVHDIQNGLDVVLDDEDSSL